MAAGRCRTSSWGPPAMASSWAFTRGSWPTSARTPESRCCCRCSPGRCHRACTPSRQSITRRIAWSPTRRRLALIAALGGPRLPQWSSGRWTCWRPSLRWTRPNCGAATSSRALASPTPPPAGPHTTPVTTRRRSTRCSRCRRIESCARSRQSDARAETATSWASACRSMSRSPRWVSALNGVRFTSRLTEQQPVRCGTTSFGQGHETSLAQIAAEELGMPMEAVRVIHSDTDAIERGTGTVGSRSMQHGGSAVHQAAQQVRHKARDLASHLLEADPADIVFVRGTVGVAGVPDRSISWASLVAAAGERKNLPDGMEPGLAAESDFSGDGSFPFGAHCAVVEVDLETGDARTVRFFAVDDCGRIINPLLAEGQVHGGIAQGIGQAMFEEVVFDAEGTPRTGSLLDYQIPSIGEIPQVVTATTETPSPNNPLGAKGIGESGTIGSTPAIQNAVVDALSHLGVRHIDMPLTPERVWNALAAARPKT